MGWVESDIPERDGASRAETGPKFVDQYRLGVYILEEILDPDFRFAEGETPG